MSIEKFFKKINLRSDEEVIIVLHHHPIGYLKQIIITIFIILLSFFLMYPLFNYFEQIGVALFAALLLTGLIYGSREFFIWYNNVFIITNQRIIDNDQRGFFERIVSEVPYEKIADISYSVKGFWQTILKLGTIKIKAEGVDLILKNIKGVVKINQILIDLIRKGTGKSFEVKKVNSVSAGVKEKLTEDFLNQDGLAEYEDYNLDELVEEYKETFGELSLKKLLVNELEKEDKKLEKENDEEINDIKFTRR
jgi:hypothetical protein